MGHVARTERERTWAGVEDVVADREGHLAIEHPERLVLTVVHMQGHQSVGGREDLRHR